MNITTFDSLISLFSSIIPLDKILDVYQILWNSGLLPLAIFLATHIENMIQFLIALLTFLFIFFEIFIGIFMVLPSIIVFIVENYEILFIWMEGCIASISHFKALYSSGNTMSSDDIVYTKDMITLESGIEVPLNIPPRKSSFITPDMNSPYFILVFELFIHYNIIFFAKTISILGHTLKFIYDVLVRTVKLVIEAIPLVQ